MSQLLLCYTQHHAASTAQLVHTPRTDEAWRKFLSLPFCSLFALRSLPANGTERHSYSKPGAAVDQEALVTALQTGVTRAAALDATYPEPLPRLPSLLISQKRCVRPARGRKHPCSGQGSGRGSPTCPWGGGLCKSAVNTNGMRPRCRV